MKEDALLKFDDYSIIPANEEQAFYSALISEMAKLVDVNVPEVFIKKHSANIWLIFKEKIKDLEILEEFDYINNLEQLLKNLPYKESDHMVIEICKAYFLDFLLGNNTGISSNWGVYDYNILAHISTDKINLCNENQILKIRNYLDQNVGIYDVFKDMFLNLSPRKVKEALDNIGFDSKREVSKVFFETYTNNYNLINQVLKFEPSKDSFFITRKDKDKLLNADKGQVINLTGGSFYVNRILQKWDFYELLGQKLLQKFKIQSPKYHSIYYKNNYITISEDLNNLGQYIDFEKLSDYFGINNDKKIKLENISICSLYYIWTVLETYFPNNRLLMLKVIKMYIYDILFSNFDRHNKNWGITINKEGRADVAALDNECIFDRGLSYVYLEASLHKENCHILYELRNFLNESSVEFTNLFLYYFDMFTDEYLQKLIKEVEEENGFFVNPLTEENILSTFKETKETLGYAMEEAWGLVYFRPLDLEDQKKIEKTKKGIITIGSREYILNNVNYDRASEVILMSKICFLLGLKCPNYRLININGNWYTIFENKDFDFTLAELTIDMILKEPALKEVMTTKDLIKIINGIESFGFKVKNKEEIISLVEENFTKKRV